MKIEIYINIGSSDGVSKHHSISSSEWAYASIVKVCSSIVEGYCSEKFDFDIN